MTAIQYLQSKGFTVSLNANGHYQITSPKGHKRNRFQGEPITTPTLKKIVFLLMKYPDKLVQYTSYQPTTFRYFDFYQSTVDRDYSWNFT